MNGAIFVNKHTEKETIGHIVDMLSINSREIVEQLVNTSYHYFARNGVRVLSAWIPNDCLYNEVLGQHGFSRDNTENYFGARILYKDTGSLAEVENISNWYLTMGDSDVF